MHLAGILHMQQLQHHIHITSTLQPQVQVCKHTQQRTWAGVLLMQQLQQHIHGLRT